LARLGLKIFYLRTRERKLSQQAVADSMGVRQATLSNIEQGVSLPSAPLLLELCKFYDVTPTFLVDDDRGVVPFPTERWRLRDALVTVGMWVEVSKDDVVHLGDGKLLCPLKPGESFYDDDARRAREKAGRGRSQRELKALFADREDEEKSLVRALNGELRTHPRRRRPKE